MRISAAVTAKLESLLAAEERPPMHVIVSKLEEFARKTGNRKPARATIYAFMASAPTPKYVPAHLPKAVQSALYNLDMDVPVPAHQLAFYCFNYGDLAAASFAAGLPWLALYQAAQMRGFRPKSRGLLDAAMRVRGI